MIEGTFNCPICGTDSPHEHTSVEAAQFQISQTMRSKAHWHLVNKNHATAKGWSYYPSIVTGEGYELGYAHGDVAQRLIDYHNRIVDELLAKGVRA